MPVRLTVTTDRFLLTHRDSILLEAPRSWLVPAPLRVEESGVRISITPEGVVPGRTTTEQLLLNISEGRGPATQLVAILTGRSKQGSVEAETPHWKDGIGAGRSSSLPPLPAFENAREAPAPRRRDTHDAETRGVAPLEEWRSETSAPEHRATFQAPEPEPVQPSSHAGRFLATRSTGPSIAPVPEEEAPENVTSLQRERTKRRAGWAIWSTRIAMFLIVALVAAWFALPYLPEDVNEQLPAMVNNDLAFTPDEPDAPEDAPDDRSTAEDSDGTNGAESDPADIMPTQAALGLGGATSPIEPSGDEDESTGPDGGEVPTPTPPAQDTSDAGTGGNAGETTTDNADTSGSDDDTAAETGDATNGDTNNPDDSTGDTADKPAQEPVATEPPAVEPTADVVEPTQAVEPTEEPVEDAPEPTIAPTVPVETATEEPVEPTTPAEMPTEEPAIEPTLPAATETPAPTQAATEQADVDAGGTVPAEESAGEAVPTEEPTIEPTVAPESTEATDPTEPAEPTLEPQEPSVNPDNPPAQQFVDQGFRYSVDGAATGSSLPELPEVAEVSYGEWVVLSVSATNWTDEQQVFDMSRFSLIADGGEPIQIDVGNSWIASLLNYTPAYGNTDAILWAPGEEHQFVLTFLAPTDAESLQLQAGDQRFDLSTMMENAQNLQDATQNTDVDTIDATVTDVVDGETIVIEKDGVEQTVRYLGVDAPGEDNCYANESTEANRALVEGRKIKIERQATNVDAQGNWVRDVWVQQDDGRYALVAHQLVQTGAAKADISQPNTRFSSWLRGAEAIAQAEDRGLWGACGSADSNEAATGEVPVASVGRRTQM